MKLETERLIIIPCTEESVSKAEFNHYKVGPHIISHLKQLKEDESLLGWGAWLVFEKESNHCIGDIGFKGKPDSEKMVEVGYGIIPSAQNKGYATEAVREIINWAFSTNQVKNVTAQCLVNNIPSIKVLEKLNMKQIGQEDNLLKWELKPPNN